MDKKKKANANYHSNTNLKEMLKLRQLEKLARKMNQKVMFKLKQLEKLARKTKLIQTEKYNPRKTSNKKDKKYLSRTIAIKIKIQ